MNSFTSFLISGVVFFSRKCRSDETEFQLSRRDPVELVPRQRSENPPGKQGEAAGAGQPQFAEGKKSKGKKYAVLTPAAPPGKGSRQVFCKCRKGDIEAPFFPFQLQKRVAESIERKKRLIRAFKSGVTSEGQQLFKYISKT